jgi:hypothetical protein
LFLTTHLNYYIDLVTRISMVSDLENVIEHVVRIVFHHSIFRVHVVINIQRWLIGAWILGILARTTGFEWRVCQDGEVSFISSTRTMNFLVLSYGSLVQGHKVLRCTARFSCMLESSACLALHILPLRRGTIFFIVLESFLFFCLLRQRLADLPFFFGFESLEALAFFSL